MTSRHIYYPFAAVMPVCLGLGLFYLDAIGRLAAWTVFAALLGGIAGIAALVVIREIADARANRGAQQPSGRSSSRV